MSVPFTGEIRAFSFNYAPKGWAMCNGQLLQINQNTALFSLLGTTFGGDGQTTFALPDLRGRVGVGASAIISLGAQGGQQAVTLTPSQIPAHTHPSGASSLAGNSRSPANALAAKESAGETNLYGPPNGASMDAAAGGGTVGGGQAHLNMMPYLTVNYCILLQGIFPSQN